MSESEQGNHRPETVAYSHLLFRVPVLGVGLYRLIIMDAHEKQTYFGFSRKKWPGHLGSVTRLLQKQRQLDGTRSFVQVSGSPVDEDFQAGADRLEQFNIENSFNPDR